VGVARRARGVSRIFREGASSVLALNFTFMSTVVTVDSKGNII
jgi:hypothetical protein